MENAKLNINANGNLKRDNAERMKVCIKTMMDPTYRYKESMVPFLSVKN